MMAYSQHYSTDFPPPFESPFFGQTPVTAENVTHILNQSMLADGGGFSDFVLDLRRSRGAYLYDTLNQRLMLDFFTFVASSPIGLNHAKLWGDREFLDKLLFATIVNPSNSDIYSVELAEFVDTFRRLAMPEKMKYVFWISGGTLGVENALKAAFDWKVRLNFKKGYSSEKGHHVIYFKEAFHGRSGYCLSLTNTDPMKTMYFPKFSWSCVDNPKISFPLSDDSLNDVLHREMNALSEIKRIFLSHPDEVAAIIIEPIQGEGGDHHFRPEFLRHLKVLADENDAMLIFDEVQTGVGITGKMWASEHFVMPDMISFGKKMQVCGFMAGEKIDRIDDHVFKVPSRINSTWGGSLADMVRSKRNLEIIVEDNLLENATHIGQHLIHELLLLGDEFAGRVTNVRGRGLMCAFDLPSKESRNYFIKMAHASGLMILGSGEQTVRLRPPLTLTRDEADEGIDIIRHTLLCLG